MSAEYVCTLSDDLLEKAKLEVKEDPNRRTDDIEAIRQWILKQPHMKCKTDDAFILKFLRNCKFSLERTKEKIDNYLTIKSALPEWFLNRDPALPEIEELLNLGIVVPLPGYDDEGRKVFIVRPGKFDPSKVKLDNVVKMQMMVIETILEDEPTQISGIVGLLDLDGVSVKHVAFMTLPTVKKTMTVIQECQPLRFKSLNYFHEPPIFDSIFELMKRFMKEKLKQRIRLHGNNLDSLYEIIPRKLLPEEYGGEAGPIQDIIEKSKTEIMKRREQFMKDEEYSVDETKRPGKPRTLEDLFGIDGSFRKLNMD